jgi:hypothetical protein
MTSQFQWRAFIIELCEFCLIIGAASQKLSAASRMLAWELENIEDWI